MQAHVGQVVAQEALAAAHMAARIGRTIAVTGVAGAPDVTRIVKQGSGDARQGEAGAEGTDKLRPQFMAIQQPRHGKGNVQYVLRIVILDLTAPESGEAAFVQ